MSGEEITVENTFTTLAINAGAHYALGLASKGLKKLVGSKASQASGVGDVDDVAKTNGIYTIGDTNSRIKATDIRFSQSSINDFQEIVDSMRVNGWQGEAIDVVRMPDGKLTTIDNTRLASARIVDIEVKATIRNYNDPLPTSMIERFKTKQGTPNTWGEAVELRIKKQNVEFRTNNPLGSEHLPNMGGGN